MIYEWDHTNHRFKNNMSYIQAISTLDKQAANRPEIFKMPENGNYYLSIAYDYAKNNVTNQFYIWNSNILQFENVSLIENTVSNATSLFKTFIYDNQTFMFQCVTGGLYVCVCVCMCVYVCVCVCVCGCVCEKKIVAKKHIFSHCFLSSNRFLEMEKNTVYSRNFCWLRNLASICVRFFFLFLVSFFVCFVFFFVICASLSSATVIQSVLCVFHRKQTQYTT